jgi:hypothetical protein
MTTPTHQQRARALSAATAVPPELAGLLERVEQQLADQARMLAAQEARIDALESRPVDDEDGRPPRSPGSWCKTKEAMRLTGYSRSGLRKLRQQKRIVFDLSGPHCLYDVTSVRKVRKVPA